MVFLWWFLTGLRVGGAWGLRFAGPFAAKWVSPNKICGRKWGRALIPPRTNLVTCSESSKSSAFVTCVVKTNRTTLARTCFWVSWPGKGASFGSVHSLMVDLSPQDCDVVTILDCLSFRACDTVTYLPRLFIGMAHCSVGSRVLGLCVMPTVCFAESECPRLGPLWWALDQRTRYRSGWQLQSLIFPTIVYRSTRNEGGLFANTPWLLARPSFTRKLDTTGTYLIAE